jgi:anthranilate phosphoribosyltransferase
MAGLLVGLRAKGIDSAEVAGGVRALRKAMVPVRASAPERLVDTAGTGGGAVTTFNISTAAALVVAGAGVPVAKHGNRSFTSMCGSADVLEALGVDVAAPPDRAGRCLREVGIAFLFAPAHHPALRHAASARKELGVRTFFNLLGPLANPAFATHQLVGIYDPARLVRYAEVLRELGLRRAMVVHGHGGLDEVSPTGPTRVAELRDGRVGETEIRPEEFGLRPAPPEALRGGDAAHNAAILRSILDGEKGPRRDAAVLSGAAALVAAEVTEDRRAAGARAAESIDSGEAARKLEAWIRASRA